MATRTPVKLKLQKGKLQVQVEGLVLLKIIKHCHDGLPQSVTGNLVGLDDLEVLEADADKAGPVSGVVEVTNCFPKLTSHSLAEKEASKRSERDESLHITYLRNLAKVHMDTEPVGWYRSAFYGKFISKELVQEQSIYQSARPNSVLLVYDPYSTTAGRLALKAYRLTDHFMNVFKTSKLTAGEFQKYDIDLRNVFEELDINVHNSHIVHAFLYELRENRMMSCDFDRLYMEQSSRIVNDLTSLGKSIDDYLLAGVEWQKWQREAYHQKKKRDYEMNKRHAENQLRRLKGQEEIPDDDIKRKYPPMEDPERLSSSLVTLQMNQYCGSISDNITQALNKLCVAQGMHGDVK